MDQWDVICPTIVRNDPHNDWERDHPGQWFEIQRLMWRTRVCIALCKVTASFFFKSNCVLSCARPAITARSHQRHRQRQRQRLASASLASS